MYQPLNCINCQHVFFIPVSSYILTVKENLILLTLFTPFKNDFQSALRIFKSFFSVFFYFDSCRTSQNVNISQRLTHYYGFEVAEALCFDLSHIA